MWITPTFILTIAAALSLVLAKPQLRGKATSEDVYLLDDILTEMASSDSIKTKDVDAKNNLLDEMISILEQAVEKHAKGKTDASSSKKNGPSKKKKLHKTMAPSALVKKHAKQDENDVETEETDCGESHYTASFGTVTSPNFPDPYYNNLNCKYHVRVPIGKIIKFVFTSFALEESVSCAYDNLTVHDGASSSAPILGETYCGSDTPDPIYTPNRYATLVLKTDSSAQYGGFSVDYTAEDEQTETTPAGVETTLMTTSTDTDIEATDTPSETCGGSFTGPSGTITSPNYPDGTYPNNANCEYDVEVQSGQIIEFVFTHLALETHTTCDYDNVTILDGDPDTIPFGPYCGYDEPDPILTTTNTAKVLFKTDNMFRRAGFSLDYTAQDESLTLPASSDTTTEATQPTAPSQFCNENYEGSSGTIHSPNYPDNYDNNMICMYTVTVGNGKVIEFVFTYIEMEPLSSCEFDNITVLGGSDPDVEYLGTYCGDEVPEPIYTTGPQAVLLFMSDGASTYGGFSIDFTAIDETVTTPAGTGTTATTSETCGESHYTGPSGTVTSPNFPNDYASNLNCKYHIRVPAGKIIEFVFTSFAMESTCSFDGLEMFDGESTSEPSLGIYCGQDLPEPIYTTGRYATLRFKTDGSVGYSGFSADFTAMDEQPMSTSSSVETTPASSEDCGLQQYTGSFGTLNSPNYPGEYGNNLDCTYHVTVPAGKIIEFVFTSFAMESTCSFDGLEVFDGESTSEPSLGIYCGRDLPEPIYTTGRYATLRFKTDGSVSFSGFSADFNAIDDQPMSTSSSVETTPASSEDCGIQQYTGSSGTLTSPNYPSDYPNNADCTYHVTVPAGKVIAFVFSRFAMEATCSADRLSVFDGDSTSAWSLGSYCGRTLPEPIYTTGRYATLRFISDYAITYSGFSVDFTATDDGQSVTPDPYAGCGGTFTTPVTITSPNYPNIYDFNLHCVYHVTVPARRGNKQALVKQSSNLVIELVFTHFDVEPHWGCHYDNLTVFDGASTSSPSLGTYCGNDLPDPVTTSGNTATILFITDDVARYPGFSIDFIARDPSWTTTTIVETTTAPPGACGGSFTGPSGTIMSPNYPNEYESNMNCLYLVTVETGKVIEFDFTSFSLELHSSCGWDKLTVYDGATVDAPSLGTYCGSDLPRPILTNGNTAALLFETDSSTVSTGFSVDYAARDHGIGETTPGVLPPTNGPSETCGASYAIPTGVIASPNYPDAYGANLNCEYYVMVEPGKAIVFVFTSFDLDYQPSCTSDSLTILDGDDPTGPPIGTYCGSNTPEVITTSGNAAMLVFITDGSGSNTGFSVNFMAIDQSGGGGGGGPSGSCGGNLLGLSGTIQSPNYPSNYSNLLDCVWNIHVPGGKIIRFSVIDFELEFHKTCSSDFVEILDGSRIIGQYCGSIHCGIPASTGNVVTVRMSTNGTGNAKGFSINYVAADPPTSLDTSCGLVSTATYKDGSRIINGEEAPPNALPWQVELQRDGEFLCGASVVHDSWILTAAHCISPYDPPSTYTIIAGTIHRDSHSSTAQIRTATEVIIHEGYDDDTHINDIALLKVSPLTITDAVRTICIPNSDAAVGTACTISGWGNTNSDNSLSPNYPTELLETDLFIRDPSSCLELYESDYSYTREKQLCGSNSNKDTCQGDSGGPFALLDGRRYFLEGITSYGFGCAIPDVTGAYTRVQAYTSWISEKTNEDVIPFSG